MDNDIDLLKETYYEESKHSNYQILPNRLKEVIGDISINAKKTFENERLKYILENLDVQNKKILDIGGNTGFFSFELLDLGAKNVEFYEGNRSHSEFVKLSSKLLKVDDRIVIKNKYFDFSECQKVIGHKYDIVLLLNVLHHIGDDYQNDILTIEKAKENIIKQLNMFAQITDRMIFQLGFNWKGNDKLGLFKEGTKKRNDRLCDFGN